MSGENRFFLHILYILYTCKILASKNVNTVLELLMPLRHRRDLHFGHVDNPAQNEPHVAFHIFSLSRLIRLWVHRIPRWSTCHASCCRQRTWKDPSKKRCPSSRGSPANRSMFALAKSHKCGIDGLIPHGTFKQTNLTNWDRNLFGASTTK